MQLAGQIPWELFEVRFGVLYCPDNGHPSLPIRLMVDLLLPKHARGLSGKEVVEGRLNSPYAQYFCEKTHFQKDSSSLSRFLDTHPRIAPADCTGREMTSALAKKQEICELRQIEEATIKLTSRYVLLRSLNSPVAGLNDDSANGSDGYEIILTTLHRFFHFILEVTK